MPFAFTRPVRIRIFLTGTLIALWMLPAQAQKTDAFELPVLNDIKLEGYAGGKIEGCIVNDVLKTDAGYLVRPFTVRNEKTYGRVSSGASGSLRRSMPTIIQKTTAC